MVKVYKITNNVTRKIYFGYTSQTLMERLHQHHGERRNTIISRSVRKYGKDKHTIELVREVQTVAEAKQHEQNLIAKHKTNVRKYKNGRGMNLTDGGEGASGYKFSQAQKQRFQKEGRCWYAESHNKRVYQYDQQGALVATHKSARKAATEVGAYGADISKCCRGIIRTVKGFHFSYGTFNGRDKRRGTSPLIKQITLLHVHTNTKQTFPSINKALEVIQGSRNNLLKAYRSNLAYKGWRVLTRI